MKQILFYNCKVYTMNDFVPEGDWFTVLGRKIQFVGKGKPPNAPVKINLKGKSVVPGFVDAHVHMFQTGIDSLFVDLSDLKSVDEVLDHLKSVDKGPRSWIFAHSFEEDNLTDVDFLTKDHLDKAFPRQPVWINRIDYHSAVVNSAALRRLKIPAGTEGFISKNEKPLGILRSDAYFKAKAEVVRVYPLEIKEKAVKNATNLFLRNGITAVNALEGGKIFGDEGVSVILKKMDSLPVDITIFLQEKNIYFTKHLGFSHLGGCILIDGSLGSYTAALDQDYIGMKGSRGILYEKKREFFSFIEEAHKSGIQLSFHAIGPRAIELVLDGYSRSMEKYPRYDHRHRVEHFELATDEQIKRAGNLGVIASMQPNFEYFWGGPDSMYASRIGKNWKKTNRFKTILNSGVRIAGGSDGNVTPPNPLLGVHSAVNHPNKNERITPYEALKMMTIDAAFAAFNEKRYGSISHGKDASFVVLDKDIFKVSKDKIKDIKVLETWYKGKKAFSHDFPKAL